MSRGRSMDEELQELAYLTAKFQLEDLDELAGRTSSRSEAIAFATYRQELSRTLQSSHDRLIAQSVHRAVSSDAQMIEALRKVEARESDDHLLALRLAQEWGTAPPPRFTPAVARPQTFTPPNPPAPNRQTVFNTASLPPTNNSAARAFASTSKSQSSRLANLR
jgi:hypothetical protein